MSKVTRDDSRYGCEVAVRIRCPTWADYLDLHATNLSKGGVFVATNVTAPVGCEVTVELSLPSGTMVTLFAQVVHHEGELPGMGLMFLEMEKETREALDAMVTVARFTAKNAGTPIAPAPAPKPEPTRASDGPQPREPLFGDVVEQSLLNELARRLDLPAHEQLGVEPGASADEIDVAFFRLCEKYHPVIFEKYGESTQELVKQLNQLVHTAYTELSGSADLKEL